MSAPKILMVAAVAAILSTLTCAFPRHIRSTDIHDVNKNRPSIRSMDLKEVLNKTVCPIMVDYDVNENRVPRRIKVLKCAGQPSHCLSHLSAHECCGHQDDHHHLGCVELRDTVLVSYKDKEGYSTLEVPVGCSCMIEHKTRAIPMPGH